MSNTNDDIKNIKSDVEDIKKILTSKDKCEADLCDVKEEVKKVAQETKKATQERAKRGPYKKREKKLEEEVKELKDEVKTERGKRGPYNKKLKVQEQKETQEQTKENISKILDERDAKLSKEGYNKYDLLNDQGTKINDLLLQQSEYENKTDKRASDAKKEQSEIDRLTKLNEEEKEKLKKAEEEIKNAETGKLEEMTNELDLIRKSAQVSEDNLKEMQKRQKEETKERKKEELKNKFNKKTTDYHEYQDVNLKEVIKDKSDKQKSDQGLGKLIGDSGSSLITSAKESVQKSLGAGVHSSQANKFLDGRDEKDLSKGDLKKLEVLRKKDEIDKKNVDKQNEGWKNTLITGGLGGVKDKASKSMASGIAGMFGKSKLGKKVQDTEFGRIVKGFEGGKESELTDKQEDNKLNEELKRLELEEEMLEATAKGGENLKEELEGLEDRIKENTKIAEEERVQNERLYWEDQLNNASGRDRVLIESRLNQFEEEISLGTAVPNLKEFSVGGHTGKGDNDDIAGLVHKNEYVLSSVMLDSLKNLEPANDTEQMSEVISKLDRQYKETNQNEVLIKKAIDESNDTQKQVEKALYDMTHSQDTSIDTKQNEGLAGAAIGGTGAVGVSELIQDTAEDGDDLDLDMSKGFFKKHAGKLAKFGAFAVAAAAVAGSAYYIGGELVNNYDAYQQADNDYDRDAAVAKTSGGLAGALAGGFAGAKAGGALGLLLGSAVPLLGNVVGGLAGAVTGGAAGAALGYYLGDKAGAWVQEKFAGPLDKIPDDQKKNPFVMDNHLRYSVIPEMKNALAMESNPEKKKEIQEGIDEYEELLPDILSPDSIEAWMEDEIDGAGGDDWDQVVKRDYLTDLMGGFIGNEQHYNAGIAVINDPDGEFAELTGFSKVADSVGDFLFGSPSKDEQAAQLEQAKAMSRYNAKSGTSFKSGKGNDSSNLDKMEKMGIIDQNAWGDSDIKDWEKLKTLPKSMIDALIRDNDWSDKDMQKLKDMAGSMKSEVEKYGSDESAGLEANFGDFNADVSDDVGSFKKVEYKMKNVKSDSMDGDSADPGDYKINDLFKKHTVNDKDIEGINPDVLYNLKAMGAEYQEMHGDKIQINSAFRSFGKQQKLYDTMPKGKAAKPGSSMHNYGMAIDMNTTNADKAIKSGLFEKYGFHRPVKGETWHVEPKGINRAGIRKKGQKQWANKLKGLDSTTKVANASEAKKPELESQQVSVSTGTGSGSSPETLVGATSAKTKKLAQTGTDSKGKALSREMNKANATPTKEEGKGDTIVINSSGSKEAPSSVDLQAFNNNKNDSVKMMAVNG